MQRDQSEPGIARPLFRDRIDAARLLADRLAAYRRGDTLVMGIPRGGVAVAAELARALDADLDIVVARKLGAPGAPELAVGAVTADGGSFLNQDVIQLLGVSEPYVQAVTKVQMAEARRREETLRSLRPPARIRKRTVILVDDGLATGATMRAAVRSVRKEGPARVIVAVPVGSRQACAALAEEADEVVCPHQPDPFGAIGLYYERFEPVEDVQVQRLLEAARAEAVSS